MTKCDYCEKEITDSYRIERNSSFCSSFCEGTICGEVGKN